MGKIECLDVRVGKMHSALKGPAGAVKALAMHPSLPLLASVRLDRFLRVHNVGTRAVLSKLYLKQQLTAVTWAESPVQPNVQELATPAEAPEVVDAAEANGSVHQDVAPSKSKHRHSQSKSKGNRPLKKQRGN